jgi:protein translocase SecG subunit
MIVFLTTLLILLCLVVVLLILIQRTSGGMGSALGGGAADQVLGAGSAAQLTKLTVASIAGFFILSFILYARYQSEAESVDGLQRLDSGESALSKPVPDGNPSELAPIQSEAPIPQSDIPDSEPSKSPVDSNSGN